MTPGPAHERLAALEGDWMGRYRFGTAIDGLFLLGDYQQDRGSGVDLRGHAVLGWDAAAERYALWWFDSTGAASSAPATGSWDGTTLTLELPGAARSSFTVADERLHVRVERGTGGAGWAVVREGSYSRA